MSEVNSASGEVPTPQPSGASSRPVPHAPPSNWRRWVVLVVVCAVIGWVVYWSKSKAEAATRNSTVNQVRSAAVQSGPVEKTIRLTGTTGAERFVALITPQLRGGRGDQRREAKNFNSGVTSSTAVQSNGARASSVQSNTTTSDSGAQQVQSTVGSSGGGGTAAFRSATSRVNRSGSSSAGSSGSATTNPNAPGADAVLGSTASSLGQGQGGGGGGQQFTDFLMVIEKMAKPGSMVKKGDTVAEFDRQNMMLRLDDYRAAAAQNRASFNKMVAELALFRKAHQQTVDAAKSDLDKAELDMKTVPVLSAMDAERARLALEEAQARYKQLQTEAKLQEEGLQSQIKNSEIDLRQAEIELKRAEANADRMLVRAPINGLAVVQNFFRGGEMGQIQEGDQLFPGIIFMQIVDTSSMVINASINQADVGLLRIGQRTKIRFDAYPGLELPGRVYSIGAITRPGGNRAQFVKEIPVKIKLDATDPRVIPDLTVSADVVLDTENAASRTSLAAVNTDDGGKTYYVFVKNGEDWEKRSVQLGLANNLVVSIRSGVRPGEVVALDRPRQKQTG